MATPRPRKPELEDLAKTLQQARKAMDWTLRKAEEVSKVSNSLISQLEQAQVKPSPDVLHKLSNAYDVPFDYLLNKAGYYTPPPRDARSEKIPAFVFSAAEVFDDDDWSVAQGVFEKLRQLKLRQKSER